MVERRSRKVSVILFLFAVFVLLVAITASWIYSTYKEQTAYSEKSTLAAVECGKYYFHINPESVEYRNNTLYFEIKNSLGAEIETIVVESANGKAEADVYLSQGLTIPVSVKVPVERWANVYVKGCEGLNFKNISFEPEQAG